MSTRHVVVLNGVISALLYSAAGVLTCTALACNRGAPAGTRTRALERAVSARPAASLTPAASAATSAASNGCEPILAAYTAESAHFTPCWPGHRYPEIQGACVKAGRRYFAKRLLSASRGCHPVHDWQLVSFGPGEPLLEGPKYQDDGEFSITHPLVPYDFDGHGAGGVYFLVEANHPEGPGGASPELLTVRGSALVKIEHSFGELRDEDGDGRLDGIAPTSSSPWYCPDYVQYDLAGPSLLYRGLARDGFTLHDAIARSFVTKQCPAPRRPFRLARNETLTRQGSHAAKCAHLHGVPSGEIERGLLAWCKAHPDPRCSRDCCEPSCTTLVTAILRDLERIPKLLAPVADAGASASQ